MKLPKKFSWVWILLALLVFAMVVGSMMYLTWTLGGQLVEDNIRGFAIIGGIVALLFAGGGFLGGRVFFIIGMVTQVISLGYMIYIGLAQAADGWSDLVSIMSYMFLSSIGVLLAIIGQLIASIRKMGRV
jgi:hypothetical protein